MVEKSQIGGFWPSLYEPFRTLSSRVADWVAPASEASSDKDCYRITMELPGVAEGDIKLTVDKGMVVVSGEKKTEREEKGDTWFFSERQFGSFERSFRLPADADEAAVKAELRNGVLTVTVPRKASGSDSARQVKITSA
jgi:HSP20 family protein